MTFLPQGRLIYVWKMVSPLRLMVESPIPCLGFDMIRGA